MQKITKKQMHDIYLEIYKTQDELTKILNRKIAVLEEKIGMHIDPSIDDRRSYACDKYSIRMRLNNLFFEPSKHTRRYLPKAKK